jgi:hypothetical protein
MLYYQDNRNQRASVKQNSQSLNSSINPENNTESKEYFYKIGLEILDNDSKFQKKNPKKELFSINSK